jgi:hypothetical protein
LQQPEPAAGVDGPLDVLRPAELGGNPGGQRGDLPRLGVVEHIGTARRPPRPLRRPVAGDRPLLTGLLTAHQGFPDADHRGHHDLVASAGHRMGGERHPGRAGLNHDLHQHSHRGHRARHCAPVVVRTDPVGLRGGETAAHRISQTVHADIEERLVQPGVRRVR